MARFQLDIPDDALQAIELLMEKTGTRTKKDFVDNALTLLEWAIKQRGQGFSIASIDEAGGIYRELEMPILSRVKREARASEEGRSSTNAGSR